MEQMIIYQGVLWTVVERLRVEVKPTYQPSYIDKLVRLERVEPAIEAGPMKSIWVPLSEVIGLISNVSWEISEWTQGVANGIRRGY